MPPMSRKNSTQPTARTIQWTPPAATPTRLASSLTRTADWTTYTTHTTSMAMANPSDTT